MINKFSRVQLSAKLLISGTIMLLPFPLLAASHSTCSTCIPTERAYQVQAEQLWTAIADYDRSNTPKHSAQAKQMREQITALKYKRERALKNLRHCEMRCQAQKSYSPPRQAQPITVQPVQPTMIYTPTYRSAGGLHGFAGAVYQQFTDNSSITTHTNYHTGYQVGLGYKIKQNDADINLIYTNLRANDSRNINSSALSLFPGAPGLIDFGQSTIGYTYDSLALTLGQKTNLTDKFKLNFYGGVNFTEFRKNITLNGNISSIIFLNGQMKTSYRGVGPTLGLDGYYSPFDTMPGFSLYGSFEPTMLYGTMTNNVSVSFNGVTVAASAPNENLVVPVLSSKLGLMFSTPYKNANINLKLGYQITQFFGITRDTVYNSPTNAGLQGAYLIVGATC
ncbi:MAG: hypothetical protein H0W64_05215 [Gammaproteobacteria bacterium]|nr:hypothetical protein [Gammaproteobacteria bacterium]